MRESGDLGEKGERVREKQEIYIDKLEKNKGI